MDTTGHIPDNELALARVLTEKQTREILGISESTSERMKEVGDYPPATQLSERRIGYRLIDIIRWLDKRRRPDPFQKLGDVANHVGAGLAPQSDDVRDTMRKTQHEGARKP